MSFEVSSKFTAEIWKHRAERRMGRQNVDRQTCMSGHVCWDKMKSNFLNAMRILLNDTRQIVQLEFLGKDNSKEGRVVILLPK